jgi:hypothetical protein
MQHIVKQSSTTCDAGTRKVSSSLTDSEWQLLLDAVGAYSHNILYRRLLDGRVANGVEIPLRRNPGM